MTIFSKILRILIAIVICDSFLPLSIPALAAGADWTPTGSPVIDQNLNGNLISGESSVVYDTDAGLYKMWYTQGPDSFNSLDTVVNTLISTADGTDLIADLKDFNFSNIANNDSAALKTALEYLAGLSTGDIETALQDIRPTIQYATSTDGINWTPETMTLAASSGSWDDCGVSSPSVIRINDTHYEMFYTGWSENSAAIYQLIQDANKLDASHIQTLLTDILIDKDLDQLFTDVKIATIDGDDYPINILTDIVNILNGSGGTIGRAVSTDGLNWTDSASVLTREPDSNSDAWDYYGVYSPSVVRLDADSYVMWYTGFTIDFSSFIDLIDSGNMTITDLKNALAESLGLQTGRAVSNDGGLNWTKDTDPVMDKDFGVSAPSTYTAHGVICPDVIVDSDGLYHAWYTDVVLDPQSALDFIQGTGTISDVLADSTDISIWQTTSADGVTWNQPSSALSATTSSWDSLGVGAPSVLYAGSSLKMWYTGLYLDHPTAIISNILDKNGIMAALTAGSVQFAIGLADGSDLTSITVTPSSATINIKSTRSFTALGTYSDSSTADITDFVTWNSSDPLIAYFSSAASNGVAIGLNPGTSNITASLGVITSNTAVLTVVTTSTKSHSSAGHTEITTPTPTPTPTSTSPSTTTPTPTPPSSPSGEITGFSVVILENFNSSDDLILNDHGEVQSAVEITTEDGHLVIGTASGTTMLDADGKPLSILSNTVNANPPAAPNGNAIVIAYNLEPDQAYFNPPLPIVFIYYLSMLPTDVAEKDLYLAHWDGSSWQVINSIVNIDAHTITSQFAHCGTYALMGKISATTVVPIETQTTTPVVQPTQPSETVPPTGGINWGWVIGICAALIVIIIVVLVILRRRTMFH